MTNWRSKNRWTGSNTKQKHDLSSGGKADRDAVSQSGYSLNHRMYNVAINLPLAGYLGWHAPPPLLSACYCFQNPLQQTTSSLLTTYMLKKSFFDEDLDRAIKHVLSFLSLDVESHSQRLLLFFVTFNDSALLPTCKYPKQVTPCPRWLWLV